MLQCCKVFSFEGIIDEPPGQWHQPLHQESNIGALGIHPSKIILSLHAEKRRGKRS